MAKKKLQKRPSRHERDNAGCMWGLISIFDFRNGRSTKRLLGDRRRLSKEAIVGGGHPSNQTILVGLTEKHETLADAEESKMLMSEVAKTSVKELMEEEMFNEQGSTLNQLNDYENGSEKNDSKYLNHTKKDQKRNNTKPSDNLDLEIIMEELAHIHQKQINLEIPPGEEKLVEALKLFIEQRLSNNSKCFEEDDFTDALQALSLNKGLFLKLLQDQDSDLVKRIQTIIDARLSKDQTPGSSPANLSEEKPLNSKSDDVISTPKQRNFFRRRSKSVDSNPLGEEDKDFQSRDKIVILKPGPETENMDNKASQFSFTEIKRKLRHAMGKERQGVSLDRLVLKIPPKAQNWSNGDKVGPPGENIGWSSPNRNHFYTEKFAVLKENGSPLSPVVNKTYQYPKVGGSNIYIEAKKHLLEMMENGEENTESVGGKLPKSLGRILSLPEYSGFSPCLSPRKHSDEVFITAQMRLSPRGVGKNVSGHLQEKTDLLSPRAENMEKVEYLEKCSLEVQSFTEDAIVSEAVQSSSSIVVEIEEMAESRLEEEEEKTINISSESLSDSVDGDIKKGDDEESVSPGFKSHLIGEDQFFSSPSHHTVSINIEDPDCAIDKTGRPSPVSVLDPLFTDDDVSPASTISQPVGKEIQPRQIHFEEQSSTTDQGLICTRISLEEVESAFEYVEAVLLGSGLNMDEFMLRWHSSSEILEDSLFDEVELFSSRPRHDQKLLFDCANVALKELCQGYFGKSQHIRPVPKGMDLIQEIWKRVEWCLFQHPQPHSLDKLVKRDLTKSGDWMNLLSDIEVIVFEMGETIFDEIIEDVVMNFAEVDISL
ncbi:hypothetical protein ABFS83_02G163700 [Erythranthe nasuta]